MNDLNVSTKDSLVVIIDMCPASYWCITRAAQHDRERLSVKNQDIPVTPTIVYISVTRFLYTLKIGWPTLHVVLIGAYQNDVKIFFQGLVEIFDMEHTIDQIKEYEKEYQASTFASGSPELHKKETAVQPESHSSLLSVALCQGLMLLNKYRSGGVGSGRIVIIDGASKYGYVSQENLINSSMHLAHDINVVIDVCSLPSLYPPILESLAESTGGLFLSYTRELLVDLQEVGNTYATVKFRDDAELQAEVPGLVDFLTYHYLPDPELRDTSILIKEKTTGVPCTCHNEYVFGIILLCPSCGALYCLNGRVPAICKICKLRLKRTPAAKQTLSHL